ncbi:unnamed protein product [Echinostoma caproni]|uniref:G_PROTEIN_RECEP_F1_2 domain-containing protein n=1 Tax=Echinostoma caproni TaxID=27848 RepID=A0A183AB12_9TREM|nr:unnamed protein product [Echinostoma caproni]
MTFRNNLSFTEIAIVCVLSMLTVLTIAGNFLVMFAIFVKTKLRQNVTNCFIASLAAADLLLGTVVMPFAIIEYHNSAEMNYLTEEQRNSYVAWPYGQDWCDLWHAFDVLSSTASILNLCIISVERYIAISDPFNYHTRMTHSRALIMIAIAWICSALISFPAIVWWRNSSANYQSVLQPNPLNGTLITECTFPVDQLYLFLSSCVSFHIPLIVMVFVYWKIYRTATRVMQGLTRGTAVVDGSVDGERLVLRVHRGGSNKNHPSPCQLSAAGAPSDTIYMNEQFGLASHSPCDSEASSPVVPLNVHPIEMNEALERTSRRPDEERHVRFARNPVALNRFSVADRCCPPCRKCVCCGFAFTARFNHTNGQNEHLGDLHDPDENASAQSDRKKRSFNLKKRLKRFSQEQRAAKTLGVIMGTFICCWLPFFIYNTIKSISPSLIKEHDYIIFPLVTWLGFVNSSINPFIYAFSLRDIKRVFRETLCQLCSHGKRESVLPGYCLASTTSVGRQITGQTA